MRMKQVWQVNTILDLVLEISEIVQVAKAFIELIQGDIASP